MRPPEQPVILIAGDDPASSGVRDRLSNLPVALCQIEPSLRDDAEASRKLMSEIDLLVVGGTGNRARGIAESALSLGTHAPKLLDLSGAYCGHPDWVYGFPELTPEQADKIARAPRVTNPGCYATGAVALLRPLVDAGLLPPSYPITVNLFDGGALDSPSMREGHPAENVRVLALEEEQVPEVTTFSGLTLPPILVRTSSRAWPGILVSIPFHLDLLNRRVTGAEMLTVLAERYRSTAHISVVTLEFPESRGWEEINETGAMELGGVTNERLGHTALIARLDHSGKGGIGAALQNIALMLGLETAEESPLIESARDA